MLYCILLTSLLFTKTTEYIKQRLACCVLCVNTQHERIRERTCVKRILLEQSYLSTEDLVCIYCQYRSGSMCNCLKNFCGKTTFLSRLKIFL